MQLARRASDRNRHRRLRRDVTEAVAYSGGRDSLATFPVGHAEKVPGNHAIQPGFPSRFRRMVRALALALMLPTERPAARLAAGLARFADRLTRGRRPIDGV